MDESTMTQFFGANPTRTLGDMTYKQMYMKKVEDMDETDALLLMEILPLEIQCMIAYWIIRMKGNKALKSFDDRLQRGREAIKKTLRDWSDDFTLPIDRFSITAYEFENFLTQMGRLTLPKLQDMMFTFENDPERQIAHVAFEESSLAGPSGFIRRDWDLGHMARTESGHIFLHAEMNRLVPGPDLFVAPSVRLVNRERRAFFLESLQTFLGMHKEGEDAFVLHIVRGYVTCPHWAGYRGNPADEPPPQSRAYFTYQRRTSLRFDMNLTLEVMPDYGALIWDDFREPIEWLFEWAPTHLMDDLKTRYAMRQVFVAQALRDLLRLDVDEPEEEVDRVGAEGFLIEAATAHHRTPNLDQLITQFYSYIQTPNTQFVSLTRPLAIQGAIDFRDFFY
jgi:hypothetical protein